MLEILNHGVVSAKVIFLKVEKPHLCLLHVGSGRVSQDLSRTPLEGSAIKLTPVSASS